MLKKYFNPETIFLFVIFIGMPVCASYSLLDPFIAPRVILVAASVILLIAMIFMKPQDVQWLKSIPVISLSAFLLLYAFSIAKSLNPGDAWYEWMKTFLGFPIMLLAAVLLRSPESRISMLKFSQVTVILHSGIYIYQWLRLYNNPSLDTVYSYSLHVASTLGNKNFYAELICLLLVFSVMSFFTFKKHLKYFSLFNILLLMATLFAVKSMAAVVAVFIAAVVASIAIYKAMPEKKISFWKISGIVASVMAVGLVILFQSKAGDSFSSRIRVIKQYVADPSLADSTARANNNSTYERIMLWRNTVKLIQDEPITGCGAGNWKLIYPKYGISGTRYIETGSTHYEHPHNDYLAIASEAGLLAALAFILFLFSIGWYSWRNMKASQHRLWMAGILFAVVSFAVTSLFSFPRVRFYVWIQLSVFAGLLFAIVGNENSVQKKNGNGIWRAILLGCGLIATWTLIAGVTRYQGEVHSHLLQVAKAQKNFPRMVRESSKASSWYFPIDETATPFTWYTGMAYFYSGQLPAAKAAYEDALEKNPYHIQLLNDLATTYEQTNERGRAIETYQRALKVTPLFPHTLLNISACYFNVGKKDSAFIYFDKLYGIRLKGQENRSYASYIAPILREKIDADAHTYPEDLQSRAMAAARDSAFVTAVYKKSKQNGLSFNQAVIDSLSH